MRGILVWVGILDHHPVLYISTELKHLRGTGIESVFMVLPVKTEMVFQMICNRPTLVEIDSCWEYQWFLLTHHTWKETAVWSISLWKVLEE